MATGYESGTEAFESSGENYRLTLMFPVPSQPFFSLLTHELRDEQYKKK